MEAVNESIRVQPPDHRSATTDFMDVVEFNRKIRHAGVLAIGQDQLGKEIGRKQP